MAANRVMWICRIASTYFVGNARVLVTVTITMEVKKEPVSAIVMAKHLPGVVEGTRSP